MPSAPQRRDPAPDRRRLEAELGDQRRVETALPRQRHLGAQARVAARGDRSADGPRDSRQRRHGAMPWRSTTPVASRSRLSRNGPTGRAGSPPISRTRRHPRFAGRALQKVARLGKAGEPPRGDMRHRREAGAAQLDAGGDDVVMGDAARMIDEHRRPRREQFAQPLAGQVVARRDLDRGGADQLGDRGGAVAVAAAHAVQRRPSARIPLARDHVGFVPEPQPAMLVAAPPWSRRDRRRC